jgi:hypothetical protein
MEPCRVIKTTARLFARLKLRLRLRLASASFDEGDPWIQLATAAPALAHATQHLVDQASEKALPADHGY